MIEMTNTLNVKMVGDILVGAPRNINSCFSHPPVMLITLEKGWIK
jgi:hypothetical protein